MAKQVEDFDANLTGEEGKTEETKPVGSNASKKVSIPRLQKKRKRQRGCGPNALNAIISARYQNCVIIYLSAPSVVTIIV
jgi:hypothetical protein